MNFVIQSLNPMMQIFHGSPQVERRHVFASVHVRRVFLQHGVEPLHVFGWLRLLCGSGSVSVNVSVSVVGGGIISDGIPSGISSISIRIRLIMTTNTKTKTKTNINMFPPCNILHWVNPALMSNRVQSFRFLLHLLNAFMFFRSEFLEGIEFGVGLLHSCCE